MIGMESLTYVIEDTDTVQYSISFSPDFDGLIVGFEYADSNGSYDDICELDSSFLDNFALIVNLITIGLTYDSLKRIVSSSSDFVDFSFSNLSSKVDSILSNIDGLPSQIQNLLDNFYSQLSSLGSQILQKGDTLLNEVDGKANEIIVALSNISLSDVHFSSLDGAYGSFRDGTEVVVTSLDGIFVVESSFLLRNDDKNFLVCYLLKDKNDQSRKIIVPSIFVKVSGA